MIGTLFNPSNQPLTLPFALQERVAELEAAAATADAAAERERSECKASSATHRDEVRLLNHIPPNTNPSSYCR